MIALPTTTQPTSIEQQSCSVSRPGQNRQTSTDPRILGGITITGVRDSPTNHFREAPRNWDELASKLERRFDGLQRILDGLWRDLEGAKQRGRQLEGQLLSQTRQGA